MRYPTTNDQYGPAGAPLNPWFSVWFRPRATIQYLANTKPMYGFYPIIVLFGFVYALTLAQEKQLGDRVSDLNMIFVICLILGPLAMLAGTYLSAYFLRWAGKAGEGKASIQDLNTAMVWSYVPLIVPGFLFIPRISMHGVTLFTKKFAKLDLDSLPPEALTLEVSNIIASLVFAVWSLVLLSKMIAYVQGFESGWKGFRNILKATVFLFLIVFAVVFVITVILKVSGVV